MTSFLSIVSIRKLLQGKSIIPIPKTPGWYRWWFNEEGTKYICSVLKNVNTSLFQCIVIEGKKYYALYFGIAKDLQQRIQWHILQKHSSSAVKSGFLSTLRQSLSGILGVDMTSSENDVNKFIDNHCYLEYSQCISKNEASSLEKKELSNHYYVLNLNGNTVVPKCIQTQLSGLREKHRR